MKVAAKQCETCIYRPDSPLDLKALETEVADPYMPGFFRAWRVCHHLQTALSTRGACCRGFWNKHKDRFTAGQVAQRLGLVKMIQEKAVAPPREKAC